jgi:hypothetical protein
MTTVNNSTQIARDSGHWYLPQPDFTAKTFYEVPKKDGSGMRATDKRDARKVGAVCGVTTITKCWKNVMLQMWLENRALEFGYKSAAMPSIEAVKEAYEGEASKPAERGKDVHGIVERGLIKQEQSPEDAAIYGTFARGMEQTGIRLIGDFAERAFACPDYGCRLDALADSDSGLVVVDFKTLESALKKRKPYPTEMMQIAANTRLLNWHTQHTKIGSVTSGALIYMDPQGQIIGAPERFTVEEMAPWLKKFDALLACWKVLEDMA